MRGIGVAHGSRDDRSVETYDYKLKYRLEGRKRALSDNDQSDDSEGPSNKKSKCNNSSRMKKRPVKERLGSKKHSSESSDFENEPRILCDLTLTENDEAESLAREIAHNLFEEKDELILRLVSVVGTRMAIKLFQETQKIEKEGGMMIVNGKRRRTPGGVFFFLLKHDNNVTSDQRKMIFYEENKIAAKDRKSLQAMKRDQKVEELKKRLTEQDHLPLPNISSASSNENSVNLSNPPPSPVVGHDNSPEYKSHAINEVDKLEESVFNEAEKLEATEQSRNDSGLDGLTSYDDDFLDITCDDMELCKGIFLNKVSYKTDFLIRSLVFKEITKHEITHNKKSYIFY
uniref:Phosphorylated adapter RNA export protein n=1 Tax=Megaselia scalaris TaxID=36166 RepID=T1GS94_MEGSC